MTIKTRNAWLIRLSFANAAFLVVEWFVANILADRTKPSMLISICPQTVFLFPGMLLLLICLARRRPKLALANLLFLAPFSWISLGGQFHIGTVKPNAATMRILTYNVHSFAAGEDAVLKTIQAQNPDIICLQESLGGYDWQFRSLFPGYYTIRRGELLIASRWPITEPRWLRHKKVIVEALEIRTNETKIVSVHLASYENWRRVFDAPDKFASRAWYIANLHARQATFLVDNYKDDSSVILCGDFNSPPRGRAYSTISSVFTDSFANVGMGFGFSHPSQLPSHRIDYIFLHGLKPITCDSVSAATSDHMPVVAEVTKLP